MNRLKQRTLNLVLLPLLIAVFSVLLIPAFFMSVDALRIVHDKETAIMMTEALRDLTPTSNPDAFMVRRHVSSNMAHFTGFTPLSKESGFFYIEDVKRIIHLTFTEALAQMSDNDQTSAGYASPAELFGPGIHLLTETGNLTADVVSYIYSRALPQTYLQNYGWRITEDIDESSEMVWRYLKATMENPELKSMLHHLLNYYHPSQTLYVGNQSWQTTALMGSDIKNIVFHPGIESIPPFINRGYASNSIAINRIVLPATVKVVSNHAFSIRFRINELVFSRTLDAVPANNAFDGVLDILGLTDLYYRDNERFKIDETLNLMPLVTFVINDIDQTVLFDLSTMNLYFQSRSIDIIDYIIHYDQHDQVLSKVYLYTADGYYGYIVPVKR